MDPLFNCGLITEKKTVTVPVELELAPKQVYGKTFHDNIIYNIHAVIMELYQLHIFLHMFYLSLKKIF